MSFLNFCAFSGMKVVMAMDSEARSWGRKGPPDGSTGRLEKRVRRTDYVGRFGRGQEEPGIYEQDGYWIVVMDDPALGEVIDGLQTPLIFGAGDFDVHPDSLDEYEERAERLWHIPVNREKTISMSAQEAFLDNRKRISELPETPAWELDEIIPHEHVDSRKNRLVVRSIDWRDDGPVYNVSAYDLEGRSLYGTYLRDGDIKSVIRGNVWREAHGETLAFSSIEDEIAFAHGMGRVTSVRNPASNLYQWTLEEYVEAVRNDIADYMTNGFIPFTDKRHISAFRLEDRELGERVRQKTIEGFSIAPFKAAI